MHTVRKKKKGRRNKETRARRKFFFSLLTSSNKFRPSFFSFSTTSRRERSLVRIFEGLFVEEYVYLCFISG